MSTGIPFIIITSGFAFAGPPLALLTLRNRSRPALWVGAACLVSILGDILGRIAAHRVGNNYWVSTIDEPAMFTCFLVALLEWQVTRVERLTFRIAIFIFLVVYVLLVWLVEDVSTFSHYALPMYCSALTAAGAWTFLRRTAEAHSHTLLRSDWVWIAGGLALYGIIRLLTEPFAGALLAAQRLDLFVRVWEIRAGMTDLVFLALTIGVLQAPSAAEPA